MPNPLDPLGLFTEWDARRLGVGAALRPSASPAPTKAAYADLVRSMREEEEAARVYRERAARASAVGDTTSAELWLHIAQEEEQHRAQFWTRIGEVYGS